MEALIILTASLAFYCLPTILAVNLHHKNLAAVIVVNLLLGWTVIGWIAALVWSVMASQRKEVTVA